MRSQEAAQDVERTLARYMKADVTWSDALPVVVSRGAAAVEDIMIKNSPDGLDFGQAI